MISQRITEICLQLMQESHTTLSISELHAQVLNRYPEFQSRDETYSIFQELFESAAQQALTRFRIASPEELG